mgnify:CR=1 FL=1|jgi:hypothetical protein
MRTIKIIAALLITQWIGIGIQDVFAQQDENIARTFAIKVKAGQGEKFVEAFKKHVAWRKKAGETWNWTTYQVANGQALGLFIARSGGHTWADLNSHEAYSIKGGLDFNANVAPYIETITSTIGRSNPNLSRLPENLDGVKMISGATYSLKPNKVQAFTAAFAKFHKLAGDHNYLWHYLFINSVNG